MRCAAATSLNSITDAFLHSSEAQSNGFGDGLSNDDFVNKLYHSMGRSQAQINADTDGVNYWVNALNSNALSRATVAQAFMELAENLQHSSGFVTGWATLRAAGNSEPTTAQVNAFLADQDFVSGLYLNVLARDPDAGGRELLGEPDQRRGDPLDGNGGVPELAGSADLRQPGGSALRGPAQPSPGRGQV